MADKRPPTYDDLWAMYHDGRLSSTVLIALMRRDQVFAAYCKRMVRVLRELRDAAAREWPA